MSTSPEVPIIVREVSGKAIGNSRRRAELIHELRLNCVPSVSTILVVTGTLLYRRDGFSADLDQLFIEFGRRFYKPLRGVPQQQGTPYDWGQAREECLAGIKRRLDDASPTALTADVLPRLIEEAVALEGVTQEAWTANLRCIGARMAAHILAAHLRSQRAVVVDTGTPETPLITNSCYDNAKLTLDREKRPQSPALAAHLLELCRTGSTPVVTGSIGWAPNGYGRTIIRPLKPHLPVEAIGSLVQARQVILEAPPTVSTTLTKRTQ